MSEVKNMLGIDGAQAHRPVGQPVNVRGWCNKRRVTATVAGMAIGCQFGKATYLPGQWSDLREIGLLKDMIRANYCSSSSQCKTVNFEEINNMDRLTRNTIERAQGKRKWSFIGAIIGGIIGFIQGK